MNSISAIIRRLDEMAKEKKVIKKLLADSEDQRIENLIQIFLYRDMPTVHHWTSELYAACHKMDKCKSNSRYLDYDSVAQELWYSWSDCYDDRHDMYCEDVSRKEKLPIPEHSPLNLYEFMEEYHLWLSRELSSKGAVKFSDIEVEIENLLSKYPIREER